MHAEESPQTWLRPEVGCVSFILAFVVVFFWFGMSFGGGTNPAWLMLAGVLLLCGMFIFRRSWIMWMVIMFVSISIGAFLASV